MDIHPETSLSSLLKQILADLPRDIRVRVSSLEPWDLTPDFFDLWKDVRLCPHFHLPLQSGSDAVLHRMARKVTTGEYWHLVDELLLRVPDAAITTDIIVGFPGETDVEFNETLEFVQSIPFAGGHVFSYSAREGTGAARMPDQIHGNIKRQRSGILRNVMAELAHNYQMRFLGKTVQVLWESSRKMDKAYLLSGHSPNYLRVDAISIQPMRNQYSLVKIDKINENSCEGTLSTQVMRE
jgi:threonylcarbamoyladenosine tRNA methylthiotransferase MtaB